MHFSLLIYNLQSWLLAEVEVWGMDCVFEPEMLWLVLLAVLVTALSDWMGARTFLDRLVFSGCLVGLVIIFGLFDFSDFLVDLEEILSGWFVGLDAIFCGFLLLFLLFDWLEFVWTILLVLSAVDLCRFSFDVRISLEKKTIFINVMLLIYICIF